MQYYHTAEMLHQLVVFQNELLMAPGTLLVLQCGEEKCLLYLLIEIELLEREGWKMFVPV